MSPEELIKDDFFLTPSPSLINSPFTPTTTDSCIGLSSTFSPLPLPQSTSVTDAAGMNYRTCLHGSNAGTPGIEDSFNFSFASPIYDHATDPASWRSLFENSAVATTPPSTNISLPINSVNHSSTIDSEISNFFDNSSNTSSQVLLNTKFSREKRSAIFMSSTLEEPIKAEDILKSLETFTEGGSRPIKRLKAEAQFNMLSSSSVKTTPVESSEKLPPIIIKDPTDRKAVRRARNTLAARRSRDKKKEHLQNLEDRIRELELQNEKLRLENQYLKNFKCGDH